MIPLRADRSGSHGHPLRHPLPVVTTQLGKNGRGFLSMKLDHRVEASSTQVGLT